MKVNSILNLIYKSNKHFFKLLNNKNLKNIKFIIDNVMEFCFSSDFKLFVSCAQDKSIKLF